MIRESGVEVMDALDAYEKAPGFRQMIVKICFAT